MTNPTPHGQVPAIQRYSIGYHSDEWGVRSLSPTSIYDDAGPWVRYEDHAAALTAQAISKAPDHIPEVGNMVAQAISAEPAVATDEAEVVCAEAQQVDASPSAASIAWKALRDLTDPLDEAGTKIMGHVRVFAQRQYEAGRASHGQAPAQTADFTTLGAAMRAIQQAIGLIGAPTDERMRAVRRVLRGAVVVAEDSGDIPALPAPPAMDGGEDAEQERPVQRMEGWTDTRYIAELENVARLLRRDCEKLHRVRDALSEKGGR